MIFLYILLILCIIILTIILNLVIVLVTFKTVRDYEKISPFECGFIGYEERRSSFSIHFFLVRLIFLVFDVELVLIYPFLRELRERLIFLRNILIILFVFILSIGLVIEWEKSILE